MVTSPVGARCPTCARIGRPAILDTSSSEMGRAILFGVGASVAGALAVSILLKILILLPFAIGLLDLLVVAGGMAGVGYLVGESVKYGSGRKLDKRLKYVATLGVFVGWMAVIALLPLFNVPQGLVSGTGGIVGLIASFYVAMNRVKL